ncbi:TolC family protein [Aureibacter tunicatorum]|uniref:Outer membrane protein TolC n=1 Tax=Aureibacter tunicatorum TaxID=866807 RepID=A0AAE3XN48_9BACT|nr:TolC family protein [Aureibacter tunicatorum]MDR6238935.1 outer membrane protein TolC [Aureibacter tunicatorum]BDD05139.1 membrane protein [Aureibacter tunicatorum]
MKEFKYIVLLIILCGLMITRSQAQVTLSSEDCRRLVVENNKDLKEAELRIKEAEANMKIAKKAYLPSVEASATGIYSPNLELVLGPEMMTNNLSMFATDVMMSQPIYAGGKIKAINAQAKIGQEMAGQSYELTHAEILLLADQAYWNLAAAKEAVGLSDNYLTMLTEMEDQMNAMYEVGLAPASEKLKVGVQKNQAEINLVKAKNGVEIATAYLNQLLGQELETEIILSDALIDDDHNRVNVNGGLEKALNNRNELKLAENQILLAEYDRKIARADYLPEAGVTAGYMYAYADKIGENIDPIGLVGGRVSIPVFHFGERKQKEQLAKIKKEKAQNDYSKTEDYVTLEIKQISLELEENYQQVLMSIKNVGQATESLEETKVSFDAQLNTTADVLNAQAEWQKAHFDLIIALRDYELKKTSWEKAIGALTNHNID